MSEIPGVCVCVCVCVYIYIYKNYAYVYQFPLVMDFSDQAFYTQILTLVSNYPYNLSCYWGKFHNRHSAIVTCWFINIFKVLLTFLSWDFFIVFYSFSSHGKIFLFVPDTCILNTMPVTADTKLFYNYWPQEMWKVITWNTFWTVDDVSSDKNINKWIMI